jgi:F-type H+-transporting ATPase subunit b
MLGFDVPTFIFQIANFLILLAILAKFFYRPVLDVMRKRQEQIDARIQDAEQRARQADAEREALARQSETATREAAAMLDAARNDAARERQRLLEAAKTEAAGVIDESRKTAAAEEKAAGDRLSARISQAAVKIAGALVRETSGEAVHASLVERLLEDGFGLDTSELRQAKLDFQADAKRLIVESAYALNAAQEKRLREKAAQTLDRDVEEIELDVREKPELIAGVRVLAGALVVDMSLRRLLDELSRTEATP